jgi:hypothetical protein
VGHFGSLEGTVADVRLDPVSGYVVAFTSNANTGVGMWEELVDELRRVGIPVRDCSNIDALGQPTVPPPGCVGSYLNGKTEWSISAADTNAFSLAINGDFMTELIFFEDLRFSAWRQPSIRGRFLRDPITGDIEKMQIGLHIAYRHSAKSESGRYLVGAKTAFV